MQSVGKLQTAPGIKSLSTTASFNCRRITWIITCGENRTPAVMPGCYAAIEFIAKFLCTARDFYSSAPPQLRFCIALAQTGKSADQADPTVRSCSCTWVQACRDVSDPVFISFLLGTGLPYYGNAAGAPLRIIHINAHRCSSNCPCPGLSPAGLRLEQHRTKRSGETRDNHHSLPSHSVR
jgi:hypothetical protein